MIHMSLMHLRGQRLTPTLLLSWTLPVLLATSLAAAGADHRLVDAVEDGDDDTARTLVQEGVAVNEAQPDARRRFTGPSTGTTPTSQRSSWRLARTRTRRTVTGSAPSRWRPPTATSPS